MYSGHAVQRLFERGIGRQEVSVVLTSGEGIEEYPEDEPFPSYLLLGFIDGRPLHVVVGVDEAVHTCYVVTVYEPDPAQWSADFRRRT